MGILGAVLGSLIGGKIIHIGRRKSMILCNGVAFVGSLVCSIKSLTLISLGRLIFGFACGVYSILVPLMIDETVPSYLMGSFGVATNVAINFGQMISILIGAGFSNPKLVESNYYWRLVYLFPIVF